MKKHLFYFMSGLALTILSGCASNKFNEYWDTTTINTTKIDDLSYSKSTYKKIVVKDVEEDRGVETFKVEIPEPQFKEKLTVESSLSEGEEILSPNNLSL